MSANHHEEKILPTAQLTVVAIIMATVRPKEEKTKIIVLIAYLGHHLIFVHQIVHLHVIHRFLNRPSLRKAC